MRWLFASFLPLTTRHGHPRPLSPCPHKHTHTQTYPTQGKPPHFCPPCLPTHHDRHVLTPPSTPSFHPLQSQPQTHKHKPINHSHGPKSQHASHAWRAPGKSRWVVGGKEGGAQGGGRDRGEARPRTAGALPHTHLHSTLPHSRRRPSPCPSPSRPSSPAPSPR